MFPGTTKRNEGTFGCSPVPKTGMRAHLPKPPFWVTERGRTVLRTSQHFLRTFLAISNNKYYSKNSESLRKYLKPLRTCLAVTPLSVTSLPLYEITNENLEILFRFRFRNGKANKYPQICFRICFHNADVGHAEGTTTGHIYEKYENP